MWRGSTEGRVGVGFPLCKICLGEEDCKFVAPSPVPQVLCLSKLPGRPGSFTWPAFTGSAVLQLLLVRRLSLPQDLRGEDGELIYRPWGSWVWRGKWWVGWRAHYITLGLQGNCHGKTKYIYVFISPCFFVLI